MTVDLGFSSSELWAVVKPVASTNLCTNPSAEANVTTGWTTTSGALTTPAGGKFGSRMFSLLASAVNGRSVFSFGTIAGSTQTVTAIYVRASSALVIVRLTLGAVTFDQAHPGDGLWHLLAISGTTVGSVACTAEVRDTRTSAWTAVEFDAVQIETGRLTPTSYIDGDQDGCVWNGAPHLSQSVRDGRDGRGGQVVSLESLGFYNTQFLGTGAPPVDVASQESALSDGELFQRQRNKPRVMTLMGTIFGDGGAGGLASLHTIRRGLMDVFRPDSRTNRGPITLRYAGSAVPKLLPAYYQGGLEMDGIEASFEKMPLRLIAPDPDFVGETDESAALTALQNLTVGRFAYRDRDGVWSGMGDTTAGDTQQTKSVGKLPDGRIVVAGYLLNAGGVATADNMAVWDGVAWTALGGVTPLAIGVEAMIVARNGDVYIGGNFLDFAGIAAADRIAKWTYATNTWSALNVGANGFVYSVAEDPATGYIWFVGSFTSIGGVAANFAAYWNGSAFVATTGLTASLGPIVVGPDGRMYTTANAGLYVLTGTAWTLHTVCGSTDQISDLFTANGLLYAAGSFTTIGGVAANKIAAWNGSAWAPLGAGVSGGGVFSVTALRDGTIIASGVNWTSIGGISPPDNIAAWNGSSWAPFPANPPDSSTHGSDQYYVHVLPDDSLVVTWNSAGATFGTTATVPGRTTVTNPGSSIAYPVITIDTTGLVYQLRNATTGQAITFNAIPGTINGQITIDLRPGRKSVRGVGGANLLPYLLPGSDLTTLGLVPGDNVIELYVSGTTTATLRFRARFWSAD